jgi:hypothetical protein
MSTAIVSVYTPEGFVIGADGLRREAGTGAVVTKTARKIFFARASNAVLAYAWAGQPILNLLTSLGSSYFDFLPVSAQIANFMESAPIHSFEEYVKRFLETFYQRLLSANDGEKLTGDLDILPKAELIARVLFVGYFEGLPYRAEGSIRRRQDVLIEPDVEARTAPRDFKVFSGSKLMAQKFAFAPPCAPDSLHRASALVHEYIQRCIDNPEQDAECESIGGHIHIAEVTPRGYKWRVPPMDG